MVGVLLINLGTPDAAEPAAVRRYLREFLSDPRVLDIHPVSRWILLNVFILPTRPRVSAAAYRKIWTERGSPLLWHTSDLAGAVAGQLGPEFQVVMGMRYGRPSIAEALGKLSAAEGIVVLPLYPHYSSASTGSSLEEVMRVLGGRWNVPAVRTIGPFWADAGYLDTFAAVGRPVLDGARPDHVLFSFHGLPERQVRKSDETGRHCFASSSCCDQILPANRFCYRATCFETARRLAARLELPADRFTVCFQSRLGRTPWIRPFTDVLVRELPGRGVRRLVVFSPAFVADCLETLEEIAIRARDDFLRHGGEDLRLVPSLNATPPWVEAVARMVRAASR